MPSNVSIALLWSITPPPLEVMEAVRAQGCPVFEVPNIFPMSAAFNAMIQRAPTPFVVQVDQDVTLGDGAVAELVEAVSRRPWYYAAWGQLFEEGFGLGGAVRCWRTSVLHLMPFRDVRCVDRDAHRRLRRIGLRRVQVARADPFGIHRPRLTRFDRFAKARGDLLKWWVLGRHDLIKAYLGRIQTAEETAGAALALQDIGTNDPAVRRSKNLEADWQEYRKAFGGLT